MKKPLAVIILGFANVCLAAQQPAAQALNYLKACDGMNMGSAEWRSCQAEIGRKNKEISDTADKKNAAAWKAIQENGTAVKRTIDDGNHLRSNSVSTKVDGVTDSAKNYNSQSNNNPASQAVTDKSLSILDQFGQQEARILDKVQSNVQTVSEPTSSSASSFNAGQQHQFVERSKPTLDQQFDAQAVRLQSSSPIHEPTGPAPTVQSRSVEQQFSSQAGTIMTSPSTVRVVAEHQRAVEAAEQAQREQQATEAAARLKAQAEQAQAEATTKRRAVEESEAEVRSWNAEINAAYMEQVQAANAWNARVQQQYNSMYAPSPYYPAYGASSYYSSPATSDNPSYFSSGSSYSYGPNELETAPHQSTPGSKAPWKSNNYFQCMDNLSTESACITRLEEADGINSDPAKTNVVDTSSNASSASTNSSSSTGGSSSITPSSTSSTSIDPAPTSSLGPGIAH